MQTQMDADLFSFFCWIVGPLCPLSEDVKLKNNFKILSGETTGMFSAFNSSSLSLSVEKAVAFLQLVCVGLL